MTSPLILVRNLFYTYSEGTPFSHTALHNVTFWLGEGEAVGVIGGTGAGKSTLLQHLNGLYRPQRGDVHILGRDLSDPQLDLREIRRQVGLVFQMPEQQLFAQYVGDDIAYGPRMSGLAGADLRERVRWAMELVGLDFDAYKDRVTWTLSGGEQRKVALAGVLAMRPRILVLDEPTAGLDPKGRQELLGHLARLRAEGMELVIASHNMADIAALTDRTYVLHEGKVVLEGTSREVLLQIDELRRFGLEAPPAAVIMSELKARGVNVPIWSLTLAEAEEALVGWLLEKVCQ